MLCCGASNLLSSKDFRSYLVLQAVSTCWLLRVLTPFSFLQSVLGFFQQWKIQLSGKTRNHPNLQILYSAVKSDQRLILWIGHPRISNFTSDPAPTTFCNWCGSISVRVHSINNRAFFRKGSTYVGNRRCTRFGGAVARSMDTGLKQARV